MADQRRTELLVVSADEVSAMRREQAEQREWILAQLARMERELELVRSSVETLSTMVGQLLAEVVRRR